MAALLGTNRRCESCVCPREMSLAPADVGSKALSLWGHCCHLGAFTAAQLFLFMHHQGSLGTWGQCSDTLWGSWVMFWGSLAMWGQCSGTSGVSGCLWVPGQCPAGSLLTNKVSNQHPRAALGPSAATAGSVLSHSTGVLMSCQGQENSVCTGNTQSNFILFIFEITSPPAPGGEGGTLMAAVELGPGCSCASLCTRLGCHSQLTQPRGWGRVPNS